MAQDIFIALDDVKGEAQDRTHHGEIEVLCWAWGLSQVGTAHAGPGAGSGKVTIQDLSFTKYVDRASPILVKMCCTGKHFKKARLTVRKAGGQAVEYLELALSDGIVASISSGGKTADNRITETIHLNFAAFKYEYTPQSKDGTASAVVPAQWNIASNSES